MISGGVWWCLGWRVILLTLPQRGVVREEVGDKCLWLGGVYAGLLVLCLCFGRQLSRDCILDF